MNVTVTRKGARGRDAIGELRYLVTFDQLPGETFGPWDFREMCRDLTVSALLTPVEARALVLDAAERGSSTRGTG